MARIRFLDVESGQEVASDDLPGVEFAESWAERNSFDAVVFHEDGDKLWVQLGEHKLNYWMPRSVLQGADRETIEMQLDYARGAQRRGAVGYDKFDR